MVVQATLRRFVWDTSATTAIEYALLASGIAIAVIATVRALGNAVNTNFFSLIANTL